jgi:regulator of protease activity HflC (stomatin/prohibitin superfamily)
VTTEAVFGLIVALAVLVMLLAMSVRIVPEYERGVIFRLGRIIGAKGPGLFFLIPIVDRMVRVSLRTTTMDIPPQDVITKDNVTVKVNAVAYFNVVDPNKSVIAIENYVYGTSQVAQTTLRSMLGQVDLDELLGKREEINQRLKQIIDDLTNPWGVKVTLVEVKDVELPETMRRAMARQAEAERDRRAKVIHAHGEFEAAETLGNAAVILERHPAAMQLRVLSTMIEVAGERNSTLIFPIPVELMRLVDMVTARLGDTTRPSRADNGPGEPREPQLAAQDVGRGAGRDRTVGQE